MIGHCLKRGAHSVEFYLFIFVLRRADLPQMTSALPVGECHEPVDPDGHKDGISQWAAGELPT